TGAAGLQIAGALIGVVALALLQTRASAMGPIRWLWAGLGFYALADWIILRPVMFSWLGLIVTLSLLERHRLASDRRRGRWALFMLVPLLFVWANIHGIVSLGVA